MFHKDQVTGPRKKKKIPSPGMPQVETGFELTDSGHPLEDVWHTVGAQ